MPCRRSRLRRRVRGQPARERLAGGKFSSLASLRLHHPAAVTEAGRSCAPVHQTVRNPRSSPPCCCAGSHTPPACGNLHGPTMGQARAVRIYRKSYFTVDCPAHVYGERRQGGISRPGCRGTGRNGSNGGSWIGGLWGRASFPRLQLSSLGDFVSGSLLRSQNPVQCSETAFSRWAGAGRGAAAHRHARVDPMLAVVATGSSRAPGVGGSCHEPRGVFR